MPNRALNQYDLDEYIKEFGIPHVRGIYMRDTLPKHVRKVEVGVINLDSIHGPGTHWVCYYKKNNICYYFDSYGLPPPKEFDEYVQCDILYNTYNIQKEKEYICGQLCIYVLYGLLVEKISFHEILISLYNLS